MSLPYLAWGVSFCDYDNDGYQDLFIANGHLDGNVQAFNPTRFMNSPICSFATIEMAPLTRWGLIQVPVRAWRKSAVASRTLTTTTTAILTYW